MYKLIFQGLKQVHDHIGNTSNYEWDKEACLEELLTHPRDFQINFTYLAMKYQLQNHKNETSKNAGQILHQLLIDAGINVDQYKQLPQSNKENKLSYCVRRKKQRQTNEINYGEEINF